MCLLDREDDPNITVPIIFLKLPPPSPRQPTDYSLRLPVGWQTNVSVYDRAWIGRALFSDKKGTLTANLKLWWEPPQYQPSSTMPTPDSYYHKRLLLWMPKKMWRVDFKCPNCPGQILRSRGLYKNVRLVMDLRDFFYIASEYLDCRECNSSFISWDER